MSPRITFSVFLLGIGLLLAFLPFNSSKTFELRPDKLLEKSCEDGHTVTVDQVARFVNNENEDIQLIDLRTYQEFMVCNIPGSINIPFSDLLNPDWEGYLNQPDKTIIFYANGDELANLSWTIGTGLGYENLFAMKGGLNEWFSTVMLSNFSGDRISARENAIFENRFKARRTFTQMNSLPDSLKRQYLDVRRLEESQLDGGCE